MARDDEDPPVEWGESYREAPWQKEGKKQSDRIIPAEILNRHPEVFDDVRPKKPAADVPRKGNGAAGPPIIGAPAVIVQRNWLDWAELSRLQPPPRSWLIAQWLSYCPTLCAGKGGIGKTLLAQELATALALGLPFIDLIEHPVPTLMWCCEDDHDELWRRELAICNLFNHQLGDLTDNLFIDARAGFENELYVTDFQRGMWTSIAGQLSEQINDTRAEVVILDNVAQMYGANENDRHHVTTFCNGLCGLAHGRPLSIIILTHPAKQMQSEFSGSSAWENACRMRWWLGDKLPDTTEEKSEDEDMRYLAKRKVNYTERDWRSFFFRDGVLYPSDRDDVPSGTRHDLYVQIKDRRVDDALITAIELLAARELYGLESGSRSLVKMILDYGLAQGYSRYRLTKAMHKLILDGRLRVELVGKSACRHPVKGLVVQKQPALILPFPPQEK